MSLDNWCATFSTLNPNFFAFLAVNSDNSSLRILFNGVSDASTLPVWSATLKPSFEPTLLVIDVIYSVVGCNPQKIESAP